MSPIKHESENGTRFQWDFDLMNGIQVKDKNILANHQKRISVNNGDVYCFQGNVSMHETTAILGERDRIVFVTAFHELEDFKHTGNVNDNNKWGHHKHRDVKLDSIHIEL